MTFKPTKNALLWGTSHIKCQYIFFVFLISYTILTEKDTKMDGKWYIVYTFHIKTKLACSQTWKGKELGIIFKK